MLGYEKTQMINYLKFCLFKPERNFIFLGGKKKSGRVVEAGIYRTVSGTQKVPKIKYTETNGHQNMSDVSCRLRRIGFMMKCS